MSIGQFAAGARVEIRDEEWIVNGAKPEASGGQAVQVTGVSELVRGKNATFLTEIDEVIVLQPEETELVADTSSRFAKTRLYLESLYRRTPPTDSAIHLGHLAAIDEVQYQLRPASKALSLLRPRFLMADGVGLGKTIEVGILLTELMQRGRGRRILVVAMKSILAQFQEELWGRFTIPLVRLDSVGIQRVQTKIPSSMNPFHFYERVIVSVDTLKNDTKYRKHLEDCHWDVIVVDECQNVAMRTKTKRGQGSQRAQLAKLLATHCDSLILTSATPHDGSEASFASLIHLLEPTAIADVNNFTREDVEPFFQRKFKKDVEHEIDEAFPPREVRPHRLPATIAETAFFEYLAETVFQTIGKSKGTGGALFRTTLLKAFLSSPSACISTVENRLKQPALQVEDLKDEAQARAKVDQASLNKLRDLAQAVQTGTFPKYDALLALVQKIVKSPQPNNRVVIFSERIDTLNFLSEALIRDCKLKVNSAGKCPAVATFHGSLDDQAQKDLVHSFGSADSPIKILLASDAAAEGINLHYFCNHLIHFDLPWSLITLTQRNGRIDRYGQKQIPYIDYLLTIPGDSQIQADLRVLDRLIEKEEQVQRNLGDPSTLMNLYSPELEEQQLIKVVQGEMTPEEALPDSPAPDEFSFEDIFGTDDEQEEPVLKAETLSLFDSDIAFAKEAFAVAVPDIDGGIDWKPDQQSFDLVPPEDLQRRYKYLPPELTRDRPRIKLTQDRDKVKAAIDAARQKEREWPEWELFWPQHPVCQWLDDRIMAELGRHEAWVVPVTGGLGDDDALFCFQGIYSNLNSQSVIVDWFAVPFQGKKAMPTIPYSEVLARSGLTDGGGNPGNTQVPEHLMDLRVRAVGHATEHMAQIRKDRASDIGNKLRDNLRSLKIWHDSGLKLIEDKETLARKGGSTVPTQKARRYKAERQEIQRIHDERRQWVTKTLQTVPAPYLRLVAVFIPA